MTCSVLLQYTVSAGYVMLTGFAVGLIFKFTLIYLMVVLNLYLHSCNRCMLKKRQTETV
jgi:hypothetical protein